jgi:Cof subfamily protein (haloacid dehalogenase superfamily)
MALVFLDLDGTMLDTGRPAKNIIDTIRQLKKNGHIPVIASGRTPHLLYGVDKVLGIDSYICANGNYINYKGNVVYERYIPKDLVKRMIETCDRLCADLVLEGVADYVAYSKRSESVDRFSDAFQIERPKINRNYHLTNEVLAFIVFEDHIVDLLRIEFPELVFNQSNRSGFDVNLKGDLKAEGIRWLVKYLDYPPDDVYAIGDGYNDISMIKAVKHGIAMGNGFPEVKAVASYITTSVEAEGVSNALRHFHLI